MWCYDFVVPGLARLVRFRKKDHEINWERDEWRNDGHGDSFILTEKRYSAQLELLPYCARDTSYSLSAVSD